MQHAARRTDNPARGRPAPTIIFAAGRVKLDWVEALTVDIQAIGILLWPLLAVVEWTSAVRSPHAFHG